jgi:hypothetical protein
MAELDDLDDLLDSNIAISLPRFNIFYTYAYVSMGRNPSSFDQNLFSLLLLLSGALHDFRALAPPAPPTRYVSLSNVPSFWVFPVLLHHRNLPFFCSFWPWKRNGSKVLLILSLILLCFTASFSEKEAASSVNKPSLGQGLGLGLPALGPKGKKASPGKPKSSARPSSSLPPKREGNSSSSGTSSSSGGGGMFSDVLEELAQQTRSTLEGMGTSSDIDTNGDKLVESIVKQFEELGTNEVNKRSLFPSSYVSIPLS